ncbi:metal ABC transporter ATP-binding protein [Acidocella sp.]|uniref:metal ABC transporter ATP-binding protein n=1 Tax=Acidocella sp. TaxID=50710 RepID=UPI002F42FB42
MTLFPLLSVQNLSVSFPGRKILQDVSFGLGPGTFCGLIGANGSGKTTLLRSILGFQEKDSGSILIEGAAATSRRRLIGYVPQKLSLDPDMPLRVRDFVALGLDGNRLGLPLPSKARTRAVDEMLAAVEAQSFADQRVGRLSGGQQQRVMIAHALIRRPRLLLLDEPLANLDMRSIAEVVDLLRRLTRDQKIAVLLSAHDMNPLLPAMDRIVYLANGKAASGATTEVVRTAVLSDLYGYHIDVIRVHGRVLVIAGEPHLGHAHDPVHVTAIP